MKATPHNSRSAERLLSLLACWPRPQLSEILFDYDDPQGALREGAVEARLLECYSELRRSKPLRFGTQPMLCVFDDGYPAQLAHIPDPPLVLFYNGDLSCLDQRSIAIVGARRATAAGRETAEQMATAFAGLGVVVTSGLARGIDGAAHTGALAGNGKTIAVLGSGLGQLYPAINRNLAQRILKQGGLLLSEYPHQQPPLAFQFPERNRIISGLSEGVVVVEAGLRSGSLITARFALEQGRDVFVVPGPVTSLVSQGCHRLIRQGAELVTDASQVAESLQIDLPDASPPLLEVADLHREQRYLLEFIRGYAVALDELIALTGWSVSKLSRTLAEMELAGIVRVEGDGYIATSRIN